MSKGYRLDYLEFPVSAELDKDTLVQCSGLSPANTSTRVKYSRQAC